MKEIKVFKNNDLGLQVRTKVNEDGSVSFNAEDTAIGFGWCRSENKNGKTYTSVMWSRMNAFCKELGFAHECAKDDYIPESLYYLLGMKAGNDKALKYQKWLAIDVLPTLRKTGKYEMPKSKAEKTPLPSVNNAAKIMRSTFKDAGVDPVYIAVAVKNLYKEKANIDVDVPLLTDTPRLYDCTEIARELGMLSKNGQPHSQAVGEIIRNLSIAEEDVIKTPFSRNGHGGVTEQYTPKVLEQVRRWVEGQGQPSKISFAGRSFTVKYGGMHS